MGHYLSDMDPDWREREDATRATRRKNTVANLKAAIAEHGIEYVLAEIIEDPTMTSLRYRGMSR